MQRDNIALAYLKKQVAWITQKIKEIEADGIIDDVTRDSVKNKPEQFPPSPHGHKANEVSFEDGDTFQDKFDDGSLTGPQGPKGDPGTAATMDSSLSTTSTNGVQNKVITAKINSLELKLKKAIFFK